jgi:hypothetical protein
MSDRVRSVDDGAMPDALVAVLKRYAAAVIIAVGFFGAALLAFFGLIAVSGCFIECHESDEHPEGALLVIAAIVLIPLTLALAARVADATDYVMRAALATGWLVGHGLLLALAANTNLVDAAYPGIDLHLMALALGVVGAVLISARAATVPAVVALVLVGLASLAWADTIGPIALPITLAALSVPADRQRYSAT